MLLLLVRETERAPTFLPNPNRAEPPRVNLLFNTRVLSICNLVPASPD